MNNADWDQLLKQINANLAWIKIDMVILLAMVLAIGTTLILIVGKG